MFLAAMFAVACAQLPSGERAYLPSELNANPTAFDGRPVRVLGLVRASDHGHSIYESLAMEEEFMRRWNNGDFDPKAFAGYCLTIINPEILIVNPEVFDRQTMELSGTFYAEYLAKGDYDFGACHARTGLLIDEQEIAARFPGIEVPAD
ncbi:hypothetical protein [Arenimonas composti]|nr:hypothetical protein [Arenimonas composti]